MEEDGGGWFTSEGNRSWWHAPLIKILKRGPLPQHVAFIMDGNRRYARSHLLPTALHGHSKGFDQLTKILEWCRDFEIAEVTVYAFSIENFKRSQEEVDGLMELFEKKLVELLNDLPKFEEKQIAVRFFGNFSYLSPNLRKLAAEVELATMTYKKSVINVCVAYTSQDEIKRAFASISRGIQKGLLEESDISEYLITKCLDSRKSNDLDLLVRTSGEKRFSDFLLWQCATCYLYFDNVLWPDFGFWNLCKAFFGYQKNLSQIKDIEEVCNENLREEQKNRVKKFLEWMDEDRTEYLRQLVETPAA